MNYIMDENISSVCIEMSNIRKLCKINEYKGEQIIYKKQPKNIVISMNDDAILKFVYDTYIDSFSGGSERLICLINNEISPSTREDINVVEFRDVIKTVNSAYEDTKICSQTILELHGYLHRYSKIRGGRYRSIDTCASNIDSFLYRDYDNDFIRNKDMVGNIENYIERLCSNYYKLINSEEIEPLIIIATFIIDFIRISPFYEENIKMAKILTLLLLNKSGYEVGIFASLGKIYDDENQLYFKALFNKYGNSGSDKYSINKWLEYFLDSILKAYERLTDEMNLTGNKKETKTRRIEKIINSTLGYFTKDDIRDLCPDIPEPTINRVFNNLRKNGKIEVVAKGRSAKWRKR